MLMWERGGGVMGALQRNENISDPVVETLPDAEPILEEDDDDDELGLGAVAQVVEEDDDELIPEVTPAPAKKKGKG